MSKYQFLLIALVSTSILFFNCKTKNSNNTNHNENVFQFKKIHKEILSPDNLKILILDYDDKMELPILFTYKVVDIKAEKEFISGTFSGLKIVWENNMSIKCYSYTAVMEKDNRNSEKRYKIIPIK